MRFGEPLRQYLKKTEMRGGHPRIMSTLQHVSQSFHTNKQAKLMSPTNSRWKLLSKKFDYI